MDGVLSSVVTVLIAVAGGAGRTARERLADAGFDVEHVTTLSAARVRAATVDVVVAGPLEDATARELRTAVRSNGAETPFVYLGGDEAFETTVEPPFDAAALAAAVRLAEQTGQYRQAVDDLYERCRERAAAGEEDLAGDEAIAEAKRRAQREFREIRRLDEGPPFERLFELDVDDADEEGGEDESDADDATGDDGQT